MVFIICFASSLTLARVVAEDVASGVAEALAVGEAETLAVGEGLTDAEGVELFFFPMSDLAA